MKNIRKIFLPLLSLLLLAGCARQNHHSFMMDQGLATEQGAGQVPMPHYQIVYQLPKKQTWRQVDIIHEKRGFFRIYQPPWGGNQSLYLYYFKFPGMSLKKAKQFFRHESVLNARKTKVFTARDGIYAIRYSANHNVSTQQLNTMINVVRYAHLRKKPPCKKPFNTGR